MVDGAPKSPEETLGAELTPPPPHEMWPPEDAVENPPPEGAEEKPPPEPSQLTVFSELKASSRLARAAYLSAAEGAVAVDEAAGGKELMPEELMG